MRPDAGRARAARHSRSWWGCGSGLPGLSRRGAPADREGKVPSRLDIPLPGFSNAARTGQRDAESPIKDTH
ncbi:hypothetical protein GCM10010398_20270 [Streptomyces fimbriatus]